MQSLVIRARHLHHSRGALSCIPAPGIARAHPPPLRFRRLVDERTLTHSHAHVAPSPLPPPFYQTRRRDGNAHSWLVDFSSTSAQLSPRRSFHQFGSSFALVLAPAVRSVSCTLSRLSRCRDEQLRLAVTSPCNRWSSFVSRVEFV